MSGQAWLVLGAGSAIARAFAREAASHGAAVILAGRGAAELEIQAQDLAIRHGVPAATLPFDALATDTHAAFAEAALAAAGGRTLNVFLAFGWMCEQAAAEADFAQALLVIQSNYAGAVSVLHRLAPVFERQGGGRIVVLGSVAGDRGRRSNYVYGSAKAGLHAFLQGLRARLFKAGVTVTTVKPGFVDTGMTWGKPGLFLVAEPEAVARAVWRAAARGREVVYVPWFWRIIMTIIRAIPEPIFKRLPL